MGTLSFASRGYQSCRPLHHALGSPHLLRLPLRELPVQSLSGGRRWTSVHGAASPCGSRSKDSSEPWSLTFPATPQGRALATTPPRGPYSEKEPSSGRPVPLQCDFLSPSLCSSLLLGALSNRSLFMIAGITEEERRSVLKERCYTKLMNK